ncbi:membrane protein of ER body-like protein isoform X1 [Chenopodium quinoa]|nr:membrane protein of ER body-like protein isoform X1 [Chenopodium quinoa]
MIVQMPDVIEHNSLEAPSPEVSRLDIIKAVVYGGLVQSITILSVVVSAAGGDASTCEFSHQFCLNSCYVLVSFTYIGFCDVFGFILYLIHKHVSFLINSAKRMKPSINILRALKQEQNTEHYEQQLGRPGHFLLHATIAIISYLVFGLMSPIIYGFSFYKSDNKYLKLAALAAVSLVCITLLSTGKAYVQRPPKAYMKTVFSYISLGIMVAGPGYIAGDLANMLLKKFEVFGSSSSGNMSVIEAKVVKGAWSSY